MYKARTNCLPANNRKRLTGENTTCILCGEKIETLDHFILECPAKYDIRKRSMALQRLYAQQIVGDFLFYEDTINENEEILYTIWRKRDRKIYQLAKHSNLRRCRCKRLNLRSSSDRVCVFSFPDPRFETEKALLALF